ncbi:hypothetical protein HER10_EVM0001098 [Colletotrichum scovillei]|uniref:Uncharacterized protein n=1 Tax=Colletotrichum scovillei TaxID=1209932 RepID=A0A9P7QRD7_9PEZI|nr:uncharacterized protein HER10_EVM0001098 [Colletotrichum scovillei]KAF4774568.1 hypothetical protein HER10_EVM0001098 [Colletotrichum scovillei]KAG7039003.1 hypothetical protein JMJ78_0001744 [Colletotrichum scovillei]KAG7041183.1 hypothetical protein JMJ77_0008887 [Colletotrichum scovillei]KAG7061215.1 hypothetical protein JMJ76_0010284 [Colletotrichum scovillei]
MTFGISKRLKRSKSADDAKSKSANDLVPIRRLTSSSFAMAPRLAAAYIDMATTWMSVEAPRGTFTVDKSKFYHPSGPLADDVFWMPLSSGDVGHCSRDGFRIDNDSCSSRVLYRVKEKKHLSKGLLMHYGSLTIDYHPSESVSRCFVGFGPNAEHRLIMMLRTDCQRAAVKVTACMVSLLHSKLQREGSLLWLKPGAVADTLEKAADSLIDTAVLVDRFIQTMRKLYQGNDREANIPGTFKKALSLLGLTKWHRIHRAINAIQCLKKAFRIVADTEAHENRSSIGSKAHWCIAANVYGMLGWRRAPASLAHQQNVLPNVLTSLEILSEVDWTNFQTSDVEERMGQANVTVSIAKEANFTPATFRTLMRFLQHRSMEFLEYDDEFGDADVGGPKQEEPQSWTGEILPAHFQMLKAMPWVRHCRAADSTFLTVLALPALEV